eukprot:UN10826
MDASTDAKGYTFDMIGDIMAKLNDNGLKFCAGDEKDVEANEEEEKVDYGKERSGLRALNNCYQGFVRKCVGKNVHVKGFSQFRRFIAFADNRDVGIDGKIVIYSPPDDCNKIPSNAVSEWYLSSTSMCLVPNNGYRLQKMDHDDDGKLMEEVKQNGNMSTQEKLKKANIGSKDTAAMITLSFHVKEMDCIACYLYALGQYTRVMARDIIDNLTLV